MSLLMDALRKAEEEKRKAAERQEQGVLAAGGDGEPGASQEDLPGEGLKLEPLGKQAAEPLDLDLAPPAMERDDPTDVTDIWGFQHETSVEDHADGSQSLSLEQGK
ncbi:MAG: hypothetical protein ACREXR_16105, partial [Gammaproteobacteria bacterium]